MPLPIKTAVMQHALDVAQLVKDNSVLKLGLPQKYPRLVIGDDVAAEPASTPHVSSSSVAVDVTATQPTTVAAPVQPLSGWKKWAGIAALAATGLAGAAVAGYLWKPKSTTVIEQGKESLLQSLEDRGYHLPPDKRGDK